MLPAREVAPPSELQAAEAELVKAAALAQPAASALRALSPRAEAAGVACVQAAQPREAAGSGAAGAAAGGGGGGVGRGGGAAAGGGGGGAGRGAAAGGGGGGGGAGRGGAAGRWWRRRRCGTRRCSGRRRRRRWCLGRGSRRRSARRWPLRFAVRAYLFLGLRHDERCGLRMRCGGRELRYRQSGGGKQHDAKVCHDVLGPRKRPGSNEFAFIDVLDDSQRVIIRPDCGRLQMARWFLFHRRNGLHAPLFIACSDRGLKRSRPVAQSVAGLGVRGPFGPRTGNSSGVLPGSSCGCGGWPGSRTGGGTSGRGLPGGSSRGGSVGCPGVAGGISGGSIGINEPLLLLRFQLRERQRRRWREVPAQWKNGTGRTAYAGVWQTASMLWPSGSSTNAP